MGEVPMQECEPERACARDAGEHALPDKDAAARDAVTAGNKLAAIVPDLIGMARPASCSAA
jgi:hypothetical protein